MTKRTALNGRRVLIVEDQYIIADEMNRAVLALGGVPVGPFASVEQAHCQLEQDEGEIALALLDVNLGGETAYPLADELEARKVAVVFATGYEDWVIPPSHRKHRIMQKPVTRAALERLIQRLDLRS